MIHAETENDDHHGEYHALFAEPEPGGDFSELIHSELL